MWFTKVCGTVAHKAKYGTLRFFGSLAAKGPKKVPGTILCQFLVDFFFVHFSLP